jgi:hypothetical protein
MNGLGGTGPGGTGQEYTGKHRRDGGLGLPGPVAWSARTESYGRPNAGGRPLSGAASAPVPGVALASGFRSEPGPLADAS